MNLSRDEAKGRAVAAVIWVDRVHARFVRIGREQPGSQAHERAAALLNRAFDRSDRAQAELDSPQITRLPDVALRQLRVRSRARRSR